MRTGRPATRSRRTATALLALAIALAHTGCAPDALPEAAPDAPAAAPLISRLPPPVPQPPHTAPPAPAPNPAPDVAPPTSEHELATLRAALVVPVAGIARTELRDSYEEKRGDRIHRAMDVLAPRGTPVLSAADGIVLKMHDSRPGGLMVYAADPTGRFILLYGHLDRYAAGLRDGAPLARGQVIGYVGTTGNASPGTPHLHFEILRGNPAVAWWEGVPVNPYPLLAP